MLEQIQLRCPYCGERFEATVDASAGSQHYIEDCPVCCRPIEMALEVAMDGSVDSIQTDTDQD